MDTPGIQIHNIGPASFSRFYSTHSEWDKKITRKLRAIDGLSLASCDAESYESSDSTVIFTEIVQPGRVILHSQCWDPDDEVAAPLVSM